MQNTLFPVKLLQLFGEMRECGLLAHLALSSQQLPVQAPDDGRIRLVLCSPEVQRIVAAEVATRQFRVRLAVPADLGLLQVANESQFEVYSVDGTPLQPAIKLSELSDNQANAVQVELFHALLKAKGSGIPLL